jgi:peptidoglycan-associated lipoprotein
MGNKGVILLLVLLLAASTGCSSKKQAVRGGSGDAGSGAAGGPGAFGGAGGGGGSDAISSETIRPERGIASGRGGAGGTGAGGAGGDRTAMAEAQAGVGVTQEKASPFQDILFDFDQSAIREDAKPVLAGIAAYLAKNPGAQIIIEGHCDSRGTAEYNMALGERRAESARKYLAALGCKSGALTTVSYGKEKPFMQGESEEAWARNRRGHFLVR